MICGNFLEALANGNLEEAMAIADRNLDRYRSAADEWHSNFDKRKMELKRR